MQALSEKCIDMEVRLSLEGYRSRVAVLHGIPLLQDPSGGW